MRQAISPRFATRTLRKGGEGGGISSSILVAAAEKRRRRVRDERDEGGGQEIFSRVERKGGESRGYGDEFLDEGSNEAAEEVVDKMAVATEGRARRPTPRRTAAAAEVSGIFDVAVFNRPGLAYEIQLFEYGSGGAKVLIV